MQRLAVFMSGLLFGAGVTVSGMVNPMKVLNFMDITGQRDPTLLFVMATGLFVTFIGYRLVLARPKPVFAAAFILPAFSLIDARLAGGAALFGIGWGLTGFCPGPAIASLAFGHWQSFLFVAAMAAGMIVMRYVLQQLASGGETVEVEG